MRTDEKIGKWGPGCRGHRLLAPVFEVSGVGLGAAERGAGGEVEEMDAERFQARWDSIGRMVPDAKFREYHRVDGGTAFQQSAADKADRPVVGGSGGIESIDQDVGVEKNHGSRVRARNCSELMAGVRAAEANRASISAGSGFGARGAGITLVSS